ncbi:MFS transporter [Actinoplanes sp. NPDC051475]|uniref:MFS transporter n=1 Tax=Actinoplanes sp. NPDC051475 TaxID=3157225 RepID=UPI00344ED7CC
MATDSTVTTALPARLKTFFGAFLFSCFCTGTVVPFNVIYLSDVRQYSVGFIGVALAAIAAAGLCVNPIGGILADRRGPAPVSFLGAVLQGTGWAIIGLAPRPWLTLLGAVVVGAGNGLFHSALTPFFVRAAHGVPMKRVSAIRYWISNVGAGGGAAIGALLGLQHDTRSFELLYVVNAASFALLGITMALIAWGARATPEAATAASPPKPIVRFAPYRDSTFRLVLAVQFVTVLFGFAQADSAVPVLVSDRLHQSLLVVGGMSALNTVVVVIAQLPLTRWTANVTETVLLGVVGALWTIAYGFGCVASVVTSTGLRLGLLAGFAVVFAVGECLLSLSVMPLVVRLAPKEALGRYSASMAMTFAGAFGLGPAAGLFIVTAMPAAMFWVILALATLILMGIAVQLHGRIAALDYAGRHRRTAEDVPGSIYSVSGRYATISR